MNEIDQTRPGSTAPGPSRQLDPRIIWRRKWYLVLSVAVTMGLGGLYLVLVPATYEVEARVLVQVERLTVEQEPRSQPDRAFLATQAEIICSPLIVERALEVVPINLPPDAACGPVETVLADLGVNPVEHTSVLKLSFRNQDAQTAVDLVNALIDSYKDYSKESQRGSYSETLQLLTRREEELRRELRDLEAEYQQLRKGSPLLGAGEEAFAAHMAMAQQLGVLLADTKNRRLDLESQLLVATELRKLQRPDRVAQISATGFRQPYPPIHLVLQRDQTPQPVVTETVASKGKSRKPFFPPQTGSERSGQDSVRPATLQAELWRARVRVKQLSQVYGPKHPDMLAALEEVRLWENALDECEQMQCDACTQQLAALKKTETHLTGLYNDEFKKVKGLDIHVLKEEQARENIRRCQEVYDSTVTKLREWQMAEEALGEGQLVTHVRVLEGPQLANARAWPQPLQFLAICAMIGLTAGGALVMVVDPQRASSGQKSRADQ